VAPPDARRRIPHSALVISPSFKPTIEKAALLVGFIPAITATGGNIRSQATTVVVRGLGMGTLKPKHMSSRAGRGKAPAVILV